jgi:hypothetical protein
MRSYRGRSGVGWSAGEFLLIGLLRISHLRGSTKFRAPATFASFWPQPDLVSGLGCLDAHSLLKETASAVSREGHAQTQGDQYAA